MHRDIKALTQTQPLSLSAQEGAVVFPVVA